MSGKKKKNPKRFNRSRSRLSRLRYVRLRSVSLSTNTTRDDFIVPKRLDRVF